MNQISTMLSVTDVEKLIVHPETFTVQDIIGIAKLLRKSPTEVFELILNELEVGNICEFER
ncbi:MULTISPECIES: hypothetical protein [Spirosoma]|jgi:hypothetical protein|uniref:hypothetical protein n=1 Tax=Spirosoma TaxID=107 RepID=UPI00036DE0B8|nr:MULTISPECIES: hypothetical protein [Spirosoma]OJW71179.1 MAG: hypothetical protein BGO59_27990 [Spirosoma sp. 48-14]